MRALNAGRGNYVPTIVGNNNDEGALFVPLLPLIIKGTSFPPKPTDLRLTFRTVFGVGFANNTAKRADAIADAAIKHYPVTDYGGDEFWRDAAALRDFLFACPARRIARAMEKHQTPSWRYRYAPRFCSEPSLADATWAGGRR